MPRFQIEDGYYVLPEIAAFLGGIFFTALIFFVDKKESFSNLFTIWRYEFPITEYVLISYLLSTTALFYILSAIVFGLSFGQNETILVRDVYFARSLFFIGCFITILSIYALFLIIDPLIAVLNFIISILVIFYWMKHS